MIVADTGVLFAATNDREEGHALAARLVAGAGRELAIPDTVIVEIDYLIRARLGSEIARVFLASISEGDLVRVPLTAGLFDRAVEIDRRYAALDLGIVDASIMALAEAEDAAILTFDFAHFRATRPRGGGVWRLLVTEAEFERERRRGRHGRR